MKIKRAFSLLEIILVLVLLGVILTSFLKTFSQNITLKNKEKSNFSTVTFCNILSKNCLFDSKIHAQTPLVEINF